MKETTPRRKGYSQGIEEGRPVARVGTKQKESFWANLLDSIEKLRIMDSSLHLGRLEPDTLKDIWMPLADSYSIFLFDLDGTLTDPKVGITASVRYALDMLGIKKIDIESLVKFIGPPLKESFFKYYSFTDEKVEEAIRYYREYFSVKGIFENSLYPGIDSLLRRLSEKGVRTFVATSKPTLYARRICEHFDIMKYFEAIEGSEMDGRNSTKSDLIGELLAKYGIDDDKALMIGDREHDVLGAKSNGIKSIGVGYGYGSREELHRAGADFYVSTVHDLSELLVG
jgi:phosphoglycolate phosphatase